MLTRRQLTLVLRQLASGLSMPVGFKNLTSGNWMKSVDGVLAAVDPHSFLSMDGEGRVAHVETKGNGSCHVVLRGGEEEPNYHIEEVRSLSTVLKKEKIPTGILWIIFKFSAISHSLLTFPSCFSPLSLVHSQLRDNDRLQSRKQRKEPFKAVPRRTLCPSDALGRLARPRDHDRI